MKYEKEYNELMQFGYEIWFDEKDKELYNQNFKKTLTYENFEKLIDDNLKINKNLKYIILNLKNDILNLKNNLRN